MKFDIVLYYNVDSSIPEEPIFEQIKKDNLTLSLDEQLDLYSEKLKKYKYRLSNNNYSKNNIIEKYLILEEDNNILEKIEKIEKTKQFISWTENSLYTISTLKIENNIFQL